MKIGAVALAAVLVTAAFPIQPGPCHVTGAIDAPDDVALAIAACESARDRFGELFDGPVPMVRIELRESPGYRIGTEEAGAAVLWPTTAAMVESAGGGPAAEAQAALQWREVLPHETAHALLTARFFTDAVIPAEEYGTPLPDWLDEGIAIWAEPPESRAERIAQARGLTEEWLDLEAILAGAHPAMGNAAAWRMRDGEAPPSDEALWAFYPQSIAVVAFVLEAGGTAAFGALVSRLLADPGDVGLEVLAKLPGMPSDAAGVLAAWNKWLQEEASPER